MPKCFFCDSELIWGGDENAEDVFDEEYEGRVYTNYSCPNCGAEFWSVSPDENKDNV